MQLVSETDPAAIVEHAIYVRWEKGRMAMGSVQQAGSGVQRGADLKFGNAHHVL